MTDTARHERDLLGQLSSGHVDPKFVQALRDVVTTFARRSPPIATIAGAGMVARVRPDGLGYELATPADGGADPASIKDGTTVTGDGGNNDSAAVEALLEGGATRTVPSGHYLVSSLNSVTLTNANVLIGNYGATFTRGNPVSTTSMLFPQNSFTVENMRFIDGGGLFDFNGLDTTIPHIRIKDCHFEDCEFATRWAELNANVSAKIGRFDFLFNTMIDVSRAVFHSGAGASDALVLGNYLDGSDRTGLNLSPEQGSPQSTGRSDRQIIAFNNVKHVAYSGANSNPIKTAGRYAVVMGNIVTDSIYNGVPDQANFEGYYSKTIGCIYMGNISVDGSGGTQGMYTFKGGGRSIHATGDEPFSYMNLAVGCIGMHSDANLYTEDGFWIQTEDCIVANCMFDNVVGTSLHVNKGAPFWNLGFYFNHWSQGRQGINVEGAHNGVRIIGDLFQTISAGHNFFVRLDTQSLGVMQNIQVQNNYAITTVTKTVAWEFMDIRANAASDDINSLQITNNLFDATAGGANARGLRFRGAGDILGTPLIMGNYFRGFVDATKVIFNETTGANATIRIGENIGFDNWVKGSAQVESGTSSEDVTHGLTPATGFTVTPDAHNIKITPTSALVTAHSWGISARTATGFTISTYTATGGAANVGANFTFDWEIYKREWTFS